MANTADYFQINGTYIPGASTTITTISDNTTSDYWLSDITVMSSISSEDIDAHAIASSVKAALLKQQEGKQKMRGLFEVFIVDPKREQVVLCLAGTCAIVAKDAEGAKMKAIMRLNFGEEPYQDIDDFDIIVRRVGDVRAKRERQEVKVVND